MKTLKLNKLKEQYGFVCNEYARKFSNKQGLTFKYWVSDIVGGVAFFGDNLYFNFQDIVWDVNSKQPKDLIIKWLDYAIENVECIGYFYYSQQFNKEK